MQRLMLAILLVLTACSGVGEVADDDEPTITPASSGTRTTDDPTAPSPPPAPGTIDARPSVPSDAGVDAANSVGDPIVPRRGNEGYDVDEYTIRVDVADDTTTIDAHTTIDATATDHLTSFSLDLVSGLSLTDVTIDAAPAGFSHRDDELRVTPSSVIDAGESFAVDVRYGGEPGPISDRFTGSAGWHHTDEVTWVMSQPHGAATWFPGNDHPSDKARFRFEITAPDGLTAVANGTQQSSPPPTDDARTWIWVMDEPMATYLATVVIDDLTIADGGTVGGVHLRDAVTADHAGGFADEHTRMLRFFEPLFGPFPFDEYGIVTVDADTGLALESQTLSLFGDGMVTDWVLAHELAHQWFGDNVTPARWRDLWLSEGFATYAHWLWDDQRDHRALEQQAAEVHADARRDDALIDLADPPAAELLSDQLYDRGALALHALRLTVGDDTFFSILRAWGTEHGGASATVDDFVSLASGRAGRDLTDFFAKWLGPQPPPPLP